LSLTTPSARIVQSGLKALDAAMAAITAYYVARPIDDLNGRRNKVTAASRDIRHFAEGIRTAQLRPDPVERETVAFGSRVTFARHDGRRSGSSGRTKPIPERDRSHMSLPSRAR
jgi:transcription elongation GreA/GreB family factor